MRIRLTVTALVLAGLVACSSSGEQSAVVTTTVASTAAPTSTEASTTVAPTTAPDTEPTTTVAERPYSLWDEVAPPTLPAGHTTPFVDNGTLTDGMYWVELNASTVAAPDVTVEQAFFGSECESVAVQMGDECLSDVYVLSPPNRIIDDLPFAPDATITVAHPNTRASYGVTPDELVQLQIAQPSAGAPGDFLFVPFGWLMTVVDGVITRFEQVWTP